ncbi:MAG: cupin domain-containing protein [Terracidiphilus sp.]|jgi:mannose-6-phosphate isomerase-like protein (cupin superfamily)
MDTFARAILKELLPAGKEAVPPAPSSHSRRNPLDHWSSPILLERAAYLRKLAALGDGSASETVKEYPQHCIMLLFRGRSGAAELHENFADIFFVIEGRATLMTGGAVAGARTIGPGEVRGDSIEGGARQQLQAGDVAHVPAGLPHQMLVAGEQSVTCLVVKIQENP